MPHTRHRLDAIALQAVCSRSLSAVGTPTSAVIPRSRMAVIRLSGLYSVSRYVVAPMNSAQRRSGWAARCARGVNSRKRSDGSYPTTS